MISPQEYRYQQECLALADSTVMFHSIAASGINRFLMQRGYSVSDDPMSWKYQRNLIGEYHEYDLRTVAAINSGNPYMQVWVPVAGVPTAMNLTKSLLADPLYADAIRVGYAFGSENYNLLRERYPDQEELIIGIFNPVPEDVVQDAIDGDILVCGNYIKTKESGRVVYKRQASSTQETLLYANEISLITDLQKWCQDMLSRWHLDAYGRIQSMYTQTFHAMLYAMMPARIAQLRLKRCGTSEVHPYHMRSKLDSVSGLGYVVDAFKLSTSYYLYRNIYALNARKGKDQTLMELVERVAVAEDLPVAGYEFKHFPDTTDEQGRVVKRLSRVSLGDAKPGYAPQHIDLSALASNQIDGFSLNPDPADIIQRAHGYNSNNAVTKHIFCATGVSDFGTPFDYHEILMAMWVYGVCNGTVTASVGVVNPHTGKQMTLSSTQALAMAYYAFCRLMFEEIPDSVPKLTISWLPKSSNLSRFGSNGFKSVSEYRLDFPTVEPNIIAAIRQGVDVVYNHATTDSLCAEALAAHLDLEKRFRHCSGTDDAFERACRLKLLTNMYWQDVETIFPMTDSLRYPVLSKALGVEIENLSVESLQQWCEELLKRATGDSQNRRDEIVRKHRALIGVLKAFVSYTVRIGGQLVDQNVLRATQPTGRSRAQTNDVSFRLRNVGSGGDNEITVSHNSSFYNPSARPIVGISEPPVVVGVKTLPTTAQQSFGLTPNRLINAVSGAGTTITVETGP